MLSTSLLAPLSLVLAATIWGLVWYPYRLLEQAGLSGSVSSLLTYLIGLPLLLALVARVRLADQSERGLLLALGVAAGWTNLAYVLAVIHGEVMRVMLLFYLAPLWTVFFARLMLGEKAGRAAYLVIALSVAGAYVMLSGNGGLPLPTNRAEWLGLSAGVGFALANVLTRKIRSAPIALRSLWVFAGVASLSAFNALHEGATPQSVLTLDVWTWLMIAGIGLSLLLATFAVQYGLAHTPANRAVVILLSELVVAALASRFLAGEAMDLREWIGGAMIVAATLFSLKLEQKNV
ncbi:MAG: DMT family transporter [Pseudomonadota bacterium]|nr:DMT family transporter [Pseudomonadota bacterium]